MKTSIKSVVWLLEISKLKLVAAIREAQESDHTPVPSRYEVLQKCLWNELMFLEVLQTLVTSGYEWQNQQKYCELFTNGE